MATKGDISGLQVLSFGGKPIVPDVEGYSGARRSGVLQSQAAGGATRQRKKYYGTVYEYNATFTLDDPQKQDYVKMFFEANVGKKFICHLAADRPLVEPYVVQVTSDWSDDYRSREDGLLSVTMEVFSVRDLILDNALLEYYGTMGTSSGPVINNFNELVEVFML